jgi:hypothetical protein
LKTQITLTKGKKLKKKSIHHKLELKDKLKTNKIFSKGPKKKKYKSKE